MKKSCCQTWAVPMVGLLLVNLTGCELVASVDRDTIADTSSNSSGAGGSDTSTSSSGMGGAGGEAGAAGAGGMGGVGGAAGMGGAAGTGGMSGAGGGSVIVEPQGTSLLIQVVDINGMPVPSALVTAKGDTMRPTDGAGYILYENLAPGRFSARVEHWGYAPASAVMELPAGAHGGTEVHLIPLPPSIPFDATSGAALDQGPVHVTIPSNALIDANGEPFTGTAQATILPLDPTTSLANVPGPLQGIAASNAEVGLESLFMAEVSLWNGAQRLQLAPGKKATLELVLPNAVAMTVQVGDTVPAWWFDLDAGIWKEDGTGTIQASVAEPGKTAWLAEVGHFTWWNCDMPWTEKNCFIVPVVSLDGLDVVPGMRVDAEGVNYEGSSTPTLTDASGKACIDIMLHGTAVLQVGPAGAPLVTVPVTGMGPAGDCAGNGALCTVLSPVTLPQTSVCIPGQTKSCVYSGPAGTEGVGNCKAATVWCYGSGTTWSGCVGEVLPQPEDCNSPADEDCDGLLNEGGTGCACNLGDTATCYTGPGGTLGVGICAAGQRTCNSGFFGACNGQIIPQVETCATAEDDDCDGTANCNGIGIWSRAFGDTSSQEAKSTAVDSAGNVVITGNFEGTVDFGGGPLTSAGVTDIFVAKFDPSGNHLWSKRFGDVDYQYGYATAIDNAGNVVLTGVSVGTVDFGGGPLTSAGGSDIVVAKFDPSGNHLWSKRFGDASDQVAYATAIDSTGNVVLTGFFEGTVDFGPGPLTCAGVYDLFVAKFGPSGNHLWSKRFGDINSIGYPRGTAIDSAGNVVITGDFDGTVDFGSGPLTSAGILDIFVAKFDPSGNHLWSKSFGGADYNDGYAMAIDDTGNVVITGAFKTTVDFGSGPLTSMGNYDIFVAKFDPSGNHLWSKRFGDADYQHGYATAIDSAGNVVIAGDFQGTTDFGGGPLTSANSVDIFVAKFDPSGNHLWSKRFGDMNGEQGWGTAIDNAGNVILTGSFDGTVNFGNGPLVGAGSSDIFLAKLTP